MSRVRLSSDVSEIKLVFSIPPHRPTPNTASSWNVAPTDPLPVVRHDAKAGERSLDDGSGRSVGKLAFARGEWVRSFAIITTTPNELCAELHNRMPVVLSPDLWSEWL